MGRNGAIEAGNNAGHGSADTMKDVTGITEIAGITDQNGALEGTVEPHFFNWPAPTVLQPRSHDTVQRGFLIKAEGWAGISPITKWNVFISFPGRNRALHYKPVFRSYFLGGVAYSTLQFNVPVNAVPRTNDFYLEIEFQAGMYSDSRWVYYLKMQGLPKPSITNPGTVRVARPTISGTGVAGSTVKLYQANSGTILFATTTVQPNGTWSVTLTQPLWMADPFQLTASQTLHGETSEWANPVSFAVLFTPAITTVTVSADGKPAISGTGGLARATLQIWIEGGAGGARLSTTVRSDGNWSVAAATAWAAGTHRITAIQFGPASGAGSGWAAVKVFTIKPAPPEIVNPGFVKTARPTISGTGAPFATVRLYQHNVISNLLAATSVANNGQWSVPLTRDLWMADPYSINSNQTLNGVESDWGTPLSFTVLFALTIETITVFADGKPTFNGYGGLAGAKVEIWRQGGTGGVLLTGTIQSNGRWTVTSSTAWAVGTHSVTARQVGKNLQHTSDWATNVDFIVKPGKPLINMPFNPAFPAQELFINGVHTGPVTLQVLDADSGKPIAGSFRGTGASRTFAPAPHWRLGLRRVKVVQTVNGMPNDSTVSAFAVAIPIPTVVFPAERAFMEMGGRFSGGRGNAGLGSRVVLYPIDANNEVAGATPFENGSWESTPLSLVPGSHQLRVGVKVDDQFSEMKICSIRVRPPQLVMSPLSEPVEARQALEITGVYSGAVTLRLLNADNSTVAGSFSGSGSSRRFTPTQDWLPGEHKVRAVQAVNSVESTPSLQLTFRARPLLPVIDVPVEHSFLPTDFQMSGTCSAGATVYLLRSDGNVILQAQVTGNTWTVNYIWEMPGFTDVRAMQVVNSVDSYPTALRQFYIKPPVPSIVPPPNPAAPRQTLSLFDVFTPGTVELRLLDDSNKEIVGDFAGVGATRLFTPRQNWPVGGSTVRLVQRVNGVDSDPSNPRVVCNLLLRLTILQPPPFGEPAQPLSIVGVHAAVQKLNMYSNGSLVPGCFSAAAGAYTFVPDRDWTPGTNTVQATQVVNELESEPSDPCTFSARPFAPAFEEPRNGASYPVGFEMSGSHRLGATLYLHNMDGTTLSWWAVDGEHWEAPYIWIVPGFKQKHLTQRVNGIESKPGPVCDFYIRPPTLTIIEPSGHSDPGVVLDITGVYSDAAVLKVFHNSKEVAGSFSGTGERRTFTPANNEWLPGSYSLTAVQEVDGAMSTPNPRVWMVVSPYPPVIDAPEEQSRQSADVQFSGTCHVGVRVYLLDEEGNTLVEGQVTGNTWTASYHWQEPGFTQVRGKQILISNNASSLPGPLRAFYIKPATPSILPPTKPVTPRQPLTVTDVYPGAVTLTVFDEAGTPVAGSFTDAGSIRQFTPDRSWASENRLHVVQTVNDTASEPSEPCTFSVRLSAPVIEYPQHDQVIDIAQPFTGSAGRPGAGAYVQLHDPLTDDELALALPDIDGHWQMPALPHGPGSHEVLARIYLDGLVSEDAHRAFKVRPPKPVIMPPASPVERLQPLIITSVYSALATLNVFDGAGRPVAGAVVGSGEDYAFTPDLEWAYGEHRISVTQVAEGVESVPSEVCVFTVEEEAIPEAPHFELPVSGSSTPSRPVVKVIGLPLAVFSVRIAQGEVLHSQAADADGVVEFIVADRLLPGSVSLEVKQQADGPESEWSEPHGFIVLPQPKTPAIGTPTPGSRVSTRPSFTGTGTTGGEIELRRTDDLANLLISIRGVSRWNWTSTASWTPGTYGVQARQVDRGDDSGWSEPRTFEVVSARLEIAEVEPVLAQPVVKEHESVLLRMQVVTAETWEGHAGLEVRWFIDGAQQNQAITLTDEHGWAEYRYAPDTVGVHQVLADVSQENEGVITHGVFEVTALAENTWMRDFALYLDGQKIDPGKGELLIRRGMPHELELRINAASRAIGSTVTLDDLANAVSQGLLFTPDLGVPQTIGSDGVRWSITTLLGEEGHFGLKLSSPNLPDWHVPGHLISDDLVDQVEVLFDALPTKAFDETLYPCHGAMHSITLRPKPGSQIAGQDVTLEWLGDDAHEHNIILSPAGDVPQRMDLDGVTWTLDCSESSRDALFALQLKVAKWGFTSRGLPMLLGNNKVVFSERQSVPWGHGGYRHSVRLTSVFNGVPAQNVWVTVTRSGLEAASRTDSRGWVYAASDEGQFVHFKFENPYDGSMVY